MELYVCIDFALWPQTTLVKSVMTTTARCPKALNVAVTVMLLYAFVLTDIERRTRRPGCTLHPTVIFLFFQLFTDIKPY